MFICVYRYVKWRHRIFVPLIAVGSSAPEAVSFETRIVWLALIRQNNITDICAILWIIITIDRYLLWTIVYTSYYSSTIEIFNIIIDGTRCDSLVRLQLSHPKPGFTLRSRTSCQPYGRWIIIPDLAGLAANDLSKSFLGLITSLYKKKDISFLTSNFSNSLLAGMTFILHDVLYGFEWCFFMHCDQLAFRKIFDENTSGIFLASDCSYRFTLWVFRLLIAKWYVFVVVFLSISQNFTWNFTGFKVDMVFFKLKVCFYISKSKV